MDPDQSGCLTRGESVSTKSRCDVVRSVPPLLSPFALCSLLVPLLTEYDGVIRELSQQGEVYKVCSQS